MFSPTNIQRIDKHSTNLLNYIQFAYQIVSFSRSSKKFIINGIKCTNEEPWIVEILVSHNREWKHLCGGALIHPSWVITAAHSLFRPDTKPITGNAAYKVCVGSKVQRLGLRYDIRSIHHPSFEIIANRKIVLNDLALIELQWQVPASVATPIPLATDCTEDYCDRTGYIYGWGATSLNNRKEFSKHLQKGTVCIGDNRFCEDITTQVDNGKICIDIDLSPSMTCNGDSGGPLVLKSESGHNLLIGISSYGDCNYEWDVYTRITAYLNWIYNIITLKSYKNKNKLLRINK